MDSDERNPRRYAVSRKPGQLIVASIRGTLVGAPPSSVSRQGPALSAYCASSTARARSLLTATVL